MVSYVTRINYGAVISEMETATGISRSLLSVALTGSFITYGVGQIISGFLGDRFSPKKLITCGFIITTAMNLLIPLCDTPYLMIAVWSVNGFAQSLMWPPLVRLMTMLLSERDYDKAVVRVSWGSSFGTILVYLVSPLIISKFNWKGVFYFSALCGVIILAVWNKFACDVNESVSPENHVGKPEKSQRVLFRPVMIMIMLAVILQGMLRDGVTTWMPSYIAQTYNLGNAVSILTGVVLPIFSIICFRVTSLLYEKKLKNPLLCSGVIFAAGALAALGLYLLTGKSAAISVLLSALLTGCMHGVNLVLVCMIPSFFRKQGNVSAVSGIINVCTYVGSALSTYGIALISERTSWRFTILTWFFIAVSGALICLVNIKPWKKEVIKINKP